MKQADRLRMAVTAMLMLSLTGCRSPKPEAVALPMAVPAAFSATGTHTVPTEWWTAFHDDQLNALMDQALTDNFSLKAAWDRLEQAWASAEKAGAARLPALDVSADASRQLSETSTSSPTAEGGRNDTTNLALGLMAAYEVDVWGRVQATRDAAALNAQASRDDLLAAAMSLTAELANTWYQLIERMGHLRLIDEQIKTNRDYLDLITLQFRQGQASATDVLQQRQLVQSNRGNRLQVESTVAVLEHRLALLAGQPIARQSIIPRSSLPDLPPLPRTGVPLEWLRRRPDLHAGERRVQAADHALAAAIADQMPRFSITVRANVSAESASDLFDNWLAALAGNMAAPIFDGGRRRAEVRRTQAARNEALNSYAQTVLTAIREVEDALGLEDKQHQYIRSLEAQLEISGQATEQTRENYIRGGRDFTRYLTTLIAHQGLQRTVLAAQGKLIEYRIALYRAIAGSWDLPIPGRGTTNEHE